MWVTLNISHAKANNVLNETHCYFVGWKSSFEAIRQYEILVNENTVYV
jgi:hypothetical protein